MSEAPRPDHRGLAPFQELIQRRCGLHFERHNEIALASALEHRQQATGLGADGYYTRLLSDGNEFDALIALLTINETYFYREANHLRLIAEHLAPRFLATLSTSRRLRILSAGCSTGEEPHSVAIALAERFGAGAGQLCEILAGDIDREALAVAEQGLYGSFSFRALPAELRARYFDEASPGQWRLKGPIRRMVRLFHYNLLAEQPPRELAEPVDIILYRNLSIYFKPHAREAILRRLLDRLSPCGHLIVGSSETFANDFGLLPQVVWGGGFFFSLDPELAGARSSPIAAVPPPTAGQAQCAPLGPPLAAAHGLPTAPAQRPPQIAPTLEQGRAELEAKHYAEALAIGEALIGTQPVAARLLAAYAKQHLHDHEGAHALAEAALEVDPWQLDALLLLGNLARQRSDTAAAIRYFRQAIYHRSECWPAHYLLAETYRLDGQTAGARREYQVLQRQLAGVPEPNPLTYFRLTAAPQELARLVEAHLTRLAAASGARHGA